mgnify:CR=1 FL=1
MTHIPRNQDFEAYAEEKPINYSTNPVWEGAIQGVLASSNKSVSDLIVLDQERCIQCARCIRFQDEIVDDPVISFYQRGRELEIIK